MTATMKDLEKNSPDVVVATTNQHAVSTSPSIASHISAGAEVPAGYPRQDAYPERDRYDGRDHPMPEGMDEFERLMKENATIVEKACAQDVVANDTKKNALHHLYHSNLYYSRRMLYESCMKGHDHCCGLDHRAHEDLQRSLHQYCKFSCLPVLRLRTRSQHSSAD